jgi:hypothetical protein
MESGDGTPEVNALGAVDAAGAQGLQVGSGNVQFNRWEYARPKAKSEYVDQVVRRIAPVELLGRDDELRQLEDFCIRSDAGDYVWWRADAWAGKTALLSWFVSHAPAGIRVVSFFITARFHAHSDREGFLENVIRQLAELQDRPMPTDLTPATRDEYMWAMLEAEARACAERGERLVLVVDGLDEDSGTVGSIAALLPDRTVAGMRVVVAGRHNPPLPSDVPQRHPLRDPAIVRALGPSSAAQGIRVEAERELDRLLDGTPLERDLLGLVTAAGGGLSGRDLAELTGRPVRAVERCLGTVAGRTFIRASVAGRYGQGTANDIYVLGHEELRRTAVEFLDARLVMYRQDLHVWADAYKRRNWPADTPEYLLRGYFRMLLATGDLDRLVGCALDGARHDRVLDVSGGDIAALTEITAAQDVLLGRAAPDLRPMALLTVRYHALAQRNVSIPEGLPVAWVALGRLERAEALIRSIPAAADQLRATKAVLRALAEHGEHARVRDLVTRAVARATAYASEAQPDDKVLASLVEVLADLGYREQAEELATVVTGSPYRGWALGNVAKALVAAGEADRAEELVRGMDDAQGRSHAASDLAQALAGVGRPDRAVAVAWMIRPHSWTNAMVAVVRTTAEAGDVERAERIASGISDPAGRAQVLAGLARFLAREGWLDRAERIARSITHPDSQAWALSEVAQALARAGDAEHAEAVARMIGAQEKQVRALAVVARTLAWTGGDARAGAVARAAEAAARGITDHHEWVWMRSEVMEALAAAGETERAEAIACAHPHPIGALADAARIMGEAGLHEGARDLARRAENRGGTGAESHQETIALSKVARAWAAAGEPEHAESIARVLRLPRWKAWALADVTRAWAVAGDLDRAHRVARDIEWSTWQVRAYVDLARAWVTNGDRAKALTRATEALVRKAEENGGESDAYLDTAWHTRALMQVAQALAEAGEPVRAEEVAREAERSAQRPHRADHRLLAFVEVVRARAEAGQTDRAEAMAREAEAMARSLTEPTAQARALMLVARPLARAGEARRADALADAARAFAGLVVRHDERQWLLVEVELLRARVRAGAGDADRALALARGAESKARIAGRSNRWRLEDALYDVLHVCVEIGNLEHAEELARGFGNPDRTVLALEHVARAWAEAGAVSRAVATGQSVNSPVQQARVLAGVARALAGAGKAGHAEALAQKAEATDRNTFGTFEQAVVLADVARAWAEAGRPEPARALANKAEAAAQAVHDRTNPRRRPMALREATRAWAAAGDPQRAQQLAESIADMTDRTWALVAASGAWAEADEPDQAEDIAQNIMNPHARAQALLDCARCAKPDRAQRLLAEALRPQGWLSAVDALGRANTEALAQVADELLIRTAPTEPGLG